MNDYICIPFEIVKNISAAIPLLRHAKEKHSQRRYDLLVDVERPFRVFAKLIKRSNGMLDIRDKLILEIGPGNSLAMAMLFIAHGAKKVYLVDRFKHLFWDNRDIDCHKKIMEEIKESGAPYASSVVNSISFDNNRNTINFDSNKIEYRCTDTTILPFADDSIDCVFSNAVLEHVHNSKQVINELARVTKKGGIGIHEIDFRDHFVKQKPLRLLRYPEWLWNIMSWNRPGYTNRLRFSDYLSLFKLAGFDIQKHLTIREYKGDIGILKLNTRFKTYSQDELRVLASWIMTKKI